MKKDDKLQALILRQKAEELLNASGPLSVSITHQTINQSEAEKLKLIQELEVHQVELEMQNEELRLAISAAQNAIELYDFAPTGYITLSKEGQIIGLNLSGAKMLGKERSHLINSHFGFFISDCTKPVFNLFLETVFTSKAKEICEATLSTNGNLPMYVHLEGIVKKK